MASSIPTLLAQKNRVNANLLSNAGIQTSQDIVMDTFATYIASDSVDVRKTLNNAMTQMFPRLATEEQAIVNNAYVYTNNIIKRKNGTFASGYVLVVATEEVDIPSGTQFSTVDGILYKSKILRTASTQYFGITSLVRTSNEVIVTLANHNLANGMEFEIAGANETAFNGVQTITLIDENTFKYENTGSNETATGTITGQYFGTLVEVESVDTTETANKTFANTITMDDFVDNIDSSYITFSGLVGGSSQESLDSLKARTVAYLEVPQNPGNKNQHQSWFTQNTTANYAYVFQTEDTFYNYIKCVIAKFDTTTLNFTSYTTQELVNIKESFISDGQVPLGCSSNKTEVTNPTFVNIDISISGLSPNTVTMKNEIKSEIKRYINLLAIKYYLSDGLNELTSSSIQNIILNTRDSSGNSPTVSSVSVSGTGGLQADITKPILGTVSFG